MHRLGTMACVVATLLLFGCDAVEPETTTSTARAARSANPPVTSPAASSPAPSASPGAATVLTGRQLRAAKRNLFSENSASFSVVLRGGGAGDRFPEVEGSWSLNPLRTVSRTTLVTDQGRFTLSFLGIGRATYSQVLGGGTFFTESCWLRTPATAATAPGALNAVIDARSDGTRSTMLVSDVLGAIGFQKYVNLETAELKGVRVPVDLRVDADRLSGWSVTVSQLTQALDQISGGYGRALVQQLLRQVAGAWWDVRFTDVGEPVSIEAPPASSLVTDGDTSACT